MKKKIVSMLVCTLLIATAFAALGINSQLHPRSTRAESAGMYTYDVFADMDAYVEEQPAGWEPRNYGRVPVLKVGTRFEFNCCYRYSLLRFDFSRIPDDAVISEATLVMHPKTGGNIRGLEVRRITEDWDEFEVTWEDKPGTWAATPPIVNDHPQEYRWDVTFIVNKWWTGYWDNHGLMILPHETGPFSYCIVFHYKDDWEHIYWPRIELTFTSSESPPPWDPPDAPPDHEDPEIDVTVSPSAPAPGDVVTVTAVGSDDVGLRYMTLTVTGPSGSFLEEWFTDEWLGETPVTLRIEERLDYGPYRVNSMAYDGCAKSSSESLTFDIMGTGTRPEVSISCSTSEVWPEDGQTIEYTVTADDPEGITSLTVGVEQAWGSHDTWSNLADFIQYNPPYPTHVEETFTFENIDIPHRVWSPLSRSYTEIKIYARAHDAEYLFNELEEYEIKVVRPYQWYYGLPFRNEGKGNLDWQRMYDIFGKKECNIDILGRTTDSHTPRASATYHGWGDNKNGVKHSCKGGVCAGMCCLSLVYAFWEYVIPDDYTYTGTDGFISPGDGIPSTAYNMVQRSIERFQGAGLSEQRIERRVPQCRETRRGRDRYSNFCVHTIPDIQADIERGVIGFISIYESTELDSPGHALVPWYVEFTGTATRIYVYDPNREIASLFDESTEHIEIDDLDLWYNDYDNYNLYPYIEVNPSSLWFRWPNDDIWDGMIAYTPYNVACKDDYRLPHGWSIVFVLGLNSGLFPNPMLFPDT